MVQEANNSLVLVPLNVSERRKVSQNMNDESNLPASDDREIRILEIKAGVQKVIYGTAIVGLAASFFPFAQETARAWFEFLNSSRTEAIAQAQNERDFLESLKVEARSGNLEERIVLAEFYAKVPADHESRGRWELFLKMLVEQREAARQADIEAKKQSNLEATPEEKAATAANLRAEQLRISAATGGTDPVAAVSLQGLLAQLESPDAATRRNARSALANLGTGLVRPAMAELLNPEPTYRLQLGLIVALTEMLRDNKRSRGDVIKLIDDTALTEILYLATNNDNTIRVYAGEFLYDLGDPRVFLLSSEVWNSGISDNGKFNIALALKGAAPFVTGPDKLQASSLVQSLIGQVGPRTEDLLRDALRFLDQN